MAKFLTTRGVSYETENIIKNAKRRLVLISPYISIPETLLQSLKDADRRKVEISLVYGKRELSSDERIKLEQLENLSLYYLENLHAKCYFNEEYMVITSLNLLDYSEQNNREMGVLVSITGDKDVFEDARKEAQLIVNSSTKHDLRRSKVHERSRDDKYSHQARTGGFCVRCRTSIPLNMEKPLCRDCFSEWSEYGNPYYQEHYCHTCGAPTPTTIDKPLCHSCYRRLFG